MQKITLTSSTRQCNNPNAFLGYEGENEANKLVFEFTDGFRDGLGVLNLKRGDEIGYVSLTKVGTTYEFPVKNSILSKTGEIKFQVVITGNDGSVIKYDPFVMTVKDAIDAESEMPEDYPDWVDMANAKLAEVDKAIANAEEVSKQLLEDKENGVFNGKDGIDGKDGVSPTVATEQTATGAKITITDVNGTHTAEVFNGKDGKDGTMTFEELTEEQKATLKGADGKDGADGFSPIANVTQIDDGAIISVTDEKGTSTATVRNGKDGADGEDGLTPHIGKNGNWWIGDTDTGISAGGLGGEGTIVAGSGVPIGTVIPYMGKNAPKEYLACDGSEYNISDYLDLANYIKEEFGSSNFFGGNGATTFAVPDLRNEFLRGYGDLSNDVGIHQDGTAFPNMYIANNGKGMLVPKYNVSSGGRHESINRDSEILESDVGSDTSKYQLSSFTGTLASNATYDTLCELYTSRPTNVAVLYCIKYTPAGFEAGEPPIATTDKLGGIKVGKGLEITEDGVLNALGGGSGSNSTITVLFEGEAATIGDYNLSDNVHNYDLIILTGYQSNSPDSYFRLCTLVIEPSQSPAPPANNQTMPYWSLGVGGNSYDYVLQGNFADGNILRLTTITKGWTESSRTCGIRKVIGIKLGGSSSSGYKEVDLISEPVEYTISDGTTTINQDLVLNDSMLNYDNIVFVTDIRHATNGGYYATTENSYLTSTMIFNDSDTAVADGSLINITKMNATHAGYTGYTIGAHLKNETTIRIRNTTTPTTGGVLYDKYRIRAIKGIKY